MEINNRTIALLIDSDNVSRDYFSIILEELSQYGYVTYRRLYGDFTKPQANGWRPALLEYSIEPIQQVAYTTGKNATDSKMIIDAMDILYKGKVDCFCIATNDSDFTSLATRLRIDNIIVIGACEKHTPESFKKACDRIIPVDDLLSASKSKKQAASGKSTGSKAKPSGIPPKLKALIKVACEIVDSGSDVDGFMHFAAFMNELFRKFPDFNVKLYGAANVKPGQFFKNLTGENGKPVFKLSKKDNVVLIKVNG